MTSNLASAGLQSPRRIASHQRSTVLRRSRQRQRHLRPRATHPAGIASRSRTARNLRRPDALGHPGRGLRVAVIVEDSASGQGRPLYEIEAWDLVIQVPDRDNPSETKTLARSRSFKALPGDLIALMGQRRRQDDLLLTLNGYTAANRGSGSDQWRGSLRDLRRAARQHRLRAARRYRPSRAYRVGSGSL